MVDVRTEEYMRGYECGVDDGIDKCYWLVRAARKTVSNLPATSMLPGHRLTVEDYANIFALRTALADLVEGDDNDSGGGCD